MRLVSEYVVCPLWIHATSDLMFSGGAIMVMKHGFMGTILTASFRAPEWSLASSLYAVDVPLKIKDSGDAVFFSMEGIM